MTGELILLVDDDPDIQDIQKAYLYKEGFRLAFAATGTEAVHLAESLEPHLIILDVALPDMDGFEVCRILRTITKVPILFLSGREDDIDQIIGHRIGGDDYVTKPFSPPVLVAKVKSHIRRFKELSESPKANYGQALIFGKLAIDRASCEVTREGKPISLAAKEYQLLCCFAENAGRVFSAEHLFDSIWGKESLGDIRTVMVHISNLRKKIEQDPARPEYITTVRGIGYKFNGG
ncbi:response regulator transcription factor [Bacillus infantis]|uniref:response regulator transcription factor n=1 Tax=Bacillus infantis TaxID=324767 RepID=UPI001CD3D89B|nr:response regulator transcription factor [Bacillus infantis]MCA1038266.1 response regulator transcription factor [Bacillus infantis]